MQLANASATSMNFIGFEELKGKGAPELLFNQIYIEPNLPQSTGKFNHAAAGFVPELVMINAQEFTKTANCWGIDNNTRGTNTNRIVLLRRE